MHLHLEPTNLPDGTYVLVPEADEEQADAQVNLVEAADPNSEPSHLEQAPEGKPRSITLYPILTYATLLLFLYLCIK